jgi:polyphosphate:AMP phosphotransferase
MLEQYETSTTVSRETYARREPELRVDLLNAQYDLKSADFSVVLLIGGDDRIGTVEVVQFLHEWLDARHLDTVILLEPTAEERERPLFWRYWNELPPNGRIAVYVGAWVLDALDDCANGRLDRNGFAERLAHIKRFEEELAVDGTLVLKLWIHTPREEMRQRLKRARQDPKTYWQFEAFDWELFDAFEKVSKETEQLLEETNGPATPWHVIDGRDDRTRDLAVAETLLTALQRRADGPPTLPVPAANEVEIPDVLAMVDLSAALDDTRYDQQLSDNQARLARNARRARQAKQSTVLVFEGWDAAGKGGAIRRITKAMTVRDYRVVPFAAPTPEEAAHHYLWRFWRRMPRAGQMLVLDRSWYGRVLVERVEGYATPDEWQRAYVEIVDFERQLIEHGILLLKFWLHVDADEQLARFKAREATPYKKYKITDDDYRNSARRADYVAAVNEMIARTDMPEARWHLIPANDKRFGRIRILETVNSELKKVLGKD